MEHQEHQWGQIKSIFDQKTVWFIGQIDWNWPLWFPLALRWSAMPNNLWISV